MRVIVSTPADAALPAEVVAKASERVTAWLNDPEADRKPILLVDGLSVEVFDDDWNFVTRSPYWEASGALGEAIEVRPDRRPLLLSAAASLASIATFVLVAVR